MNNKDNKQAIIDFLTNCDFKLRDIAKYAQEGHGFCGNDGYYALTYANEREECEIIHEGAKPIPDGKVEVTYWTGESSDIIVDLDYYLETLAEYLSLKNEKELADKVREIID